MSILNDIAEESNLLTETTDTALAIRLASINCGDNFILHQGIKWLREGSKSNALARRIGSLAVDANNDNALAILELMERLEE